MRKHHSQLDEMQQEKLLKIHSNGMNLCFGGLLATIIIQWLFERNFSNIVGEVIVFFILVIYATSAYIYEGLWSSKLKPSLKTNLFISLIPAVAVGVLLLVRNVVGDHNAYELPTILLAMAIAFVVCMVVLTILLYFYNRRRSILDAQEND